MKNDPVWFRRWYELAMKGLDTRRLQIYLGHRSILSTVVYTDLALHATDSVWHNVR